MALSQKHRSSIYLSLTPLLGDEETEALMNEFPSHDLARPATKEFVRAEVGVLRAELHEEIGALRAEMHEEIGALRAELHEEIGALRAELHEEIGALRAEMHSLFRRQTVWFAGVLLTALSASTAINAVVVSSLR